MNLTENLFKVENWGKSIQQAHDDENNKSSDFVIIVMVKNLNFKHFEKFGYDEWQMMEI